MPHTVRPVRSDEGLDMIVAIGQQMNTPVRPLGSCIDGALDIFVPGVGIHCAANAQFHAVCGPSPPTSSSSAQPLRIETGCLNPFTSRCHRFQVPQKVCCTRSSGVAGIA
jgi:hypothetical protein